ncbi:hypothetical protein JX266_010458 [Neoarthrinium moseri]|uniref:uncharacterized protein n=1 Tax=Neoarthrinium moseri TaxID=1658444 RepID=UPI001FDDD15D|nr:uncharacterized protein JN550_003337 [Neoarthrinium moseri]KAI1843284.1 hypothetical protein JX266_010458 [Neoarthrinium moseri]KAI1873084.1 hypothetical protein JN550_003337 [Neoarthrinium moseri]
MAPENGYHPTGHSSSRHGGADEEEALLGGSRSTSKPGWQEHLIVAVHRDWADVVLLLCYIITGLLDSASISTWGSFVSMQTGNTVYIGLGLAAPAESNRWVKSGVSLISFCVGSFCFSRFHRHFVPSRRWVLCASFLLQMLFIVVAAAILTFVPKSSNELDWTVLVPIALVAFQSCGQAVVSRALKYNALTSVVLTSIYCDLFSDVELFSVHNVERNRRVGAPVLLLFGAVMGGLLVHSSVGAAGILWIAALLKLLVALVWFFWRAAE